MIESVTVRLLLAIISVTCCIIIREINNCRSYIIKKKACIKKEIILPRIIKISFEFENLKAKEIKLNITYNPVNNVAWRRFKKHFKNVPNITLDK